MEGRGSPQLALAPTARLSLAVAALFGSSKGIGRNESHSSGDSALMIHGDEQTERLPFLSQSTQQTWAQVVEVAPGRGKLNMTAQLQEITTRRHRLYLIRAHASAPCSALSSSHSWPATGQNQDGSFFSTSTDAMWAECPGHQ